MMGRVNILLVDDDEICILLAKRIINSAGIANTIHSVHNGKEAIDVFNHYFDREIAIPDVILLDLNMPLMDGFEFIEAFKSLDLAHKEKVLIIVTTSSIDPADLKRVQSLGIQYYLTKPITEESIRSIILREIR
jgi:CheY-like chemotaxis protein